MKWESRDTTVAITIACILSPIILGVRDAATIAAAVAAAAYIAVDYTKHRGNESRQGDEP